MTGQDLLIVEDDPGIQMIIESLLGQNGIPHRTAGYAAQAIALAGADWPRLVLLDVTLPGDMDGWELWDQLQRMSAGRPLAVVLYTGDRHPAVQAEARKRGAVDVLFKLTARGELIRRLRSAFRAATESNDAQR